MMRGEKPDGQEGAKGAKGAHESTDPNARVEDADANASEVDTREEPEALTEADASDEPAFEDELEESPDATGALQEQGMAASELRADGAEAAEAADAPREVDTVVQEMVEACYVGEDAQARKVVMLEIALPGRGMVRARIRREKDGIHVRLRAKDPSTKELLRSHKDELLQGAKARGVDLKGVDVV